MSVLRTEVRLLSGSVPLGVIPAKNIAVVTVGQGLRGAAGATNWEGIADKPDTYPAQPHGHTLDNVQGLQAVLYEQSGAIAAAVDTAAADATAKADRAQADAIEAAALDAGAKASLGQAEAIAAAALDATTKASAAIGTASADATAKANAAQAAAIAAAALDATAKAGAAQAASTPAAHVGSVGAAHGNATTSIPGFMSATDKAKLDGVADNANNYTHPASHPAAIIVQDAGNRFVSDAEKATWNAKQAALGFAPENTASKGVPGGYASLDAGGKVPAAQLPSFVDDVIEVGSFDALPAIGESGKIYVTPDNNKTYRWGGTAYAEISASPGSTDAVPEGVSNLYHTASRVRDTLLAGFSSASSALVTAADSVLAAFGKLQAQITNHTGNASNPHGVTKAQVGLGSADDTSDANKPVSTAQQAALNAKADLSGADFNGPITSGSAKAISGDWNAVASTGWYMGDSAANSPALGWFIGYSVVHTPDWITQEVWAFANNDEDANNHRYRREKNNGVWGAWFQVYGTHAEIHSLFNQAHTFSGGKKRFENNPASSAWDSAQVEAYTPAGAAVDFSRIAFHVQDAAAAPQFGYHHGLGRAGWFSTSGGPNLTWALNGDDLRGNDATFTWRVTAAEVKASGGYPIHGFTHTAAGAELKEARFSYVDGNLAFERINDAYTAVLSTPLLIDAGGNVTVRGGTLGYGSGSGGSVAQAVSKNETVTINKPSMVITTHSSALAAVATAGFRVDNSVVGLNDQVVHTFVGTLSGVNGNYSVRVASAPGSFYVHLTNESGGTLSEAVPIKFDVIKGSTT